MKNVTFVALLATAGCSSTDSANDAALLDTHLDVLMEQGQKDGALDSARDVPVDRASDVPGDHASPDIPPDIAADSAPDITPDVAPKDAGPACVGSTLLQTFTVDMVICQGSALSQCDAAQLCGGWRLCGASEYRARGGETTTPDAEAWLGSCVRNGSALTAPSDSACSSCQGVSSMRTTSWECDGSDDTATSAARVGVASHPTCHRVGFNSATHEAFWIAKPSDIKLNAAVCCK